jgi:hypothetical protein
MSLSDLVMKLYIVDKNKELNGPKVEEATPGALAHILLGEGVTAGRQFRWNGRA